MKKNAPVIKNKKLIDRHLLIVSYFLIRFKKNRAINPIRIAIRYGTGLWFGKKKLDMAMSIIKMINNIPICQSKLNLD